MKKLVVLLPLLLAGCASMPTPSLIAPEYKVVQAPEELYYCPTIKTYPNSATLTDREVGVLLLKYHRNNKICKQNIDKLKQFYDNANTVTSPPEEKPGFFSSWFK